MMARSSAASRASGATRQALPRVAMALALVVTLGTVGASTALAAKGGNAAQTQYSTIALAGGMLQSTDPSTATFSRGSSVWFKTNVVGLKGTEYPMVYVECYSTVDGSLLYGQLDHPDAEFVLGGGWSPWFDVVPSPDATCLAHLYAYGGKSKGIDVIRELTDPAAEVLNFAAAG